MRIPRNILYIVDKSNEKEVDVKSAQETKAEKFEVTEETFDEDQLYEEKTCVDPLADTVATEDESEVGAKPTTKDPGIKLLEETIEEKVQTAVVRVSLKDMTVKS